MEKSKILIIDDHVPNLKLLGKIFAHAHYSVIPANSVREAKKILYDDVNDPVDVILSDISMPRDSGFDLLRWIKSSESPFSDIPLLLITSALPDLEHRMLGYSLGAVDYLNRDLSNEELVVRINRARENYSQLKNLKENLEDSQKLAMTSYFLAASIHEVKNLANIIGISAEISAKKILPKIGDKNPEDYRLLKSWITTSDLLVKVTRGLNDLTGSHTQSNIPIDFTKLLSEVIELLEPMFRHIKIDDKSCHSPIWVNANETQLKQVIINLLFNARDSIDEMNPEEGGRILIRCIDDEQGDSRIISIKDNGLGLNQKERRSNFEAFATTKQLRGGKGLGLWLCSHFIQRMGGELIMITDGPGLGVEVQILLKKAKQSESMDISKYFIE
jgi:signal transduction histidine kinase